MFLFDDIPEELWADNVGMIAVCDCVDETDNNDAPPHLLKGHGIGKRMIWESYSRLRGLQHVYIYLPMQQDRGRIALSNESTSRGAFGDLQVM